MDRNTGVLFLIGAFVISTIVATLLTFVYVRNGSQLRTVQMQLPQLDAHRSKAQQLAGDVFEYSKTHPEINPILQSIGATPAPTSTPAK
jgi:hypothetical protein